jgi:ABC-2 type transport system ATP-binding protein
MSNVVEVTDLSRHHRAVRALDGARFTVREHGICGLLGRNGAGKTTVLRMIAGQDRPTAGRVRVFGQDPWEHDDVLRRICFVKESQRYPVSYRVDHVLRVGALVFPGWDVAYADALVEEFALPRRRAVKKLSRGMLSALGIVIGLASRAPLTCFDEPYLGLDAVARQRFYDLLLKEMAERPAPSSCPRT